MEECKFCAVDELGDPVQKKLVAELMGRTCNLYLLGPDGRIIDCLRRIGLDESTKRQALPGLYYQEPEPVEKENPLHLEKEDYSEFKNLMYKIEELLKKLEPELKFFRFEKSDVSFEELSDEEKERDLKKETKKE